MSHDVILNLILHKNINCCYVGNFNGKMFFTELIFEKKGPLAQVWIAAHNESKLKKNQIVHADLKSSVKAIGNSSEPFALRLSAHLLLGVVRILVQKAKYLYRDLNRTVIRIRMGPVIGSKSIAAFNKGPKTLNNNIVEKVGEFSSFENTKSNDLSLASALASIQESMDGAEVDEYNANVSSFNEITLTPQKSKKAAAFSALFNKKISLSDKMTFTSLSEKLDMTHSSGTGSKRKRFTPSLEPIPFNSESLFSANSNHSNSFRSIEKRRDGDIESRPSMGIEFDDKRRSEKSQAMTEGSNVNFSELNFDNELPIEMNQTMSLDLAEQQPDKAIKIHTSFEDLISKPKKANKKQKKRKKGIKVQRSTVLTDSKVSGWRKDVSDLLIYSMSMSDRVKIIHENNVNGLREDMLTLDDEAALDSCLFGNCPPDLKKLLTGKYEHDLGNILYQEIEHKRDAGSSLAPSLAIKSLKGRDSKKMSISENQDFNFQFDNNLDQPNIDMDFSEGLSNGLNTNTIMSSPTKSGFDAQSVTQTVITTNTAGLSMFLGSEGNFLEVTQNCSRKRAAKLFHQLLVLKTKNKMAVQQEEPFDEIMYHSIDD